VRIARHALTGLIRPYPDEQTTLDLIDRQILLHPDAPALIFGEQQLSYSQLDRLANEIALMLLEQGAQPGRLLPLLVADGLELPLTIVAAMKAGIPFVPMDSRWPTDRTTALLATLGTDLLVASPRTPASAGAAGRRIEIDAAKLTGAAERPDVARPARPDIFYGFFTSGTTGLPKCTLNHHRGLLNRFTTMTRMFGGGHVALQNSRSVFDSSLWQLLWPLTSGGTVVMPVREGLLDLEQTVHQIGRHGVTITDFVPSIFAVLADLLHSDAGLTRQAASLRRVLLGGEAINVAAVRRFHEVLPHVEFTNTYGPTEASIGSVFHTFGEPPPDGHEIPIGRPIDNTSVLVVDEELNPLGPGRTGELLIGGDCVGYGYLADPERTARSFLDNPFSDVAGERLYRTGDLGQFREDGLLYFIGRADDQIKLRGVRIEPTEVEDALIRLPGIREVKVFADGELDRAQLIAAVVSDRPVTADLLDAARAVLPPEFVPDRFVRLDRLPLSPNGKADRRALAAAVRQAEAGQESRTAVTGVQARVEQLWAEVLPSTGRDAGASFFDLGGTSLSAQRLALSLRGAFGRPITVRDVVHNPTVAALTALLESDGEQAPDPADQVLADQWLDAWSQQRPAPAVPPGSILLTGATGFIGSYLLQALLRRTSATISCLVRAEDRQAAVDLLGSRLDYYQLADALSDPRVRIEVGDLALPRWGLTDERFAELADSVDAIVHSGAQVNLVTPYPKLRATNVTSVRTLIELARRGRPKAIHHLSTLSVLPRATAVDEDTCLVEENLPGDGYSQSKWCAERLLTAAREQGLPVDIYRLGEVMPHTRTGIVSHTGSLTEMLLESCGRLGVGVHTGAVSDFSPVEAVADFIARAVAEPSPANPSGSCYHVAGMRDLPLDEVLDQLSTTAGLTEVKYPEFWQLLQEEASNEAAPEAVRKLALVLPEQPEDEFAPLADQFFTSTSPAFRRNFLARCDELGLRWPDIDTTVLQRWCRGAAAVTRK
jgi:amino acid adenylation domain-containing protein/thioester reductase-like protein